MASYVLGPEDQIIIRAFQAQELSDKPIQITGDGYINLPMIGKVKAAGLSVGALEDCPSGKAEKLRAKPASIRICGGIP